MNAQDILRLVKSRKADIQALPIEKRAGYILQLIDDEVNKHPNELMFLETLNEEYQGIIGALNRYNQGKMVIAIRYDKIATNRVNNTLQFIYDVIDEKNINTNI